MIRRRGEDVSGQGGVVSTYDPARQRPRVSPIAARLAHPPRWLLWLIRTLWPIPRLFGWAGVFRYHDVAEVLTRSDVFEVPFGAEIARLNDGAEPGTPFILGIDDRDRHDRQLELVMQAFRLADVATIVTPESRDRARDVVARAGAGPLDAIPALVTGIPLHLCAAYYGVTLPEPQKFAYAAIAVSGHLFGSPPIKPDRAIDVAAAYVREVVDGAIDAELARPSGRDTVLARLVRVHRADQAQLSRKDVRAFLIGMIVGFVPTNTMAGGHILEVLLREKEQMAAAREAALAGDDDLLKHCLFETMRFMPLNPGPFRICSRDYTIAADTRRARTLKAGTKVLASTMSAMFDGRQLDAPRRFDPRRPASDYMLFGYGMHWCVGAFIAQAQITQTFKAVLLKRGLRRAGKLEKWGLFPDRLPVCWDA